MAASLPDPRAFETWEDAFQHPIPAVRGMEKKLRINIGENKEKLRTLVGGSYRDLLGTARTIVEADQQMQKVEGLLVNLGRRSDSRILDRIASNQSRLVSEQSKYHAVQFSLGAQLSLLQKCLLIVSRLLRSHSSSLLAAKLLVVARNLHRILAKEDDAEDLLVSLGKKLASLRQRLVRRVDSNFAQASGSISGLVADMTAFSLATSSTATDVLKHFQHVRLQVIKRTAIAASDSSTRLEAYLNTQVEIRSIFPELLQASLKAVAAKPLLQDTNIKALTELSLDVYLPWVASEVRNFTPYARHENLNHGATKQLLDAWTEDALQSLLQSIERDIEATVDVEELIIVRKAVLQMWLFSKRYTSILTGRDVLDRLRSLFMQRLSNLSQRDFELVYVATRIEIDSALGSWNADSKTPANLWGLSSAAVDLSNAAMSFRKAVRYHRHGSRPGIARVLNTFEDSWGKVLSFQSVIQSMSETRWDDGAEEDEDSDEEYRPSDVLSKDDPSKLRLIQKENAMRFVDRLEECLKESAHSEDKDSSTSALPALFLLRVIREFRTRMPRLLHTIDSGISQRQICSNVVVRFQTSLTNGISNFAVQDFTRLVSKSIGNGYRFKGLWEGTPPLPTQVSPGIFRFLRNLVQGMSSYGADVWSPNAVAQLRAKLRDQIAEVLKFSIKDLEQESSLETAVRLEKNDTRQEGMTDALADQSMGSTVEINGLAKKPKSTESSSETNIESDEREARKMVETASSEVNGTKDEAHLDAPESPNCNATTTDRSDAHVDKAAEKQRSSVDAADRLTSNLTQSLFDTLYLDNALSSSAEEASHTQQLQDITSDLIARTELSEASVLKLRKSSGDYWRRTYLLFGLLCT